MKRLIVRALALSLLLSLPANAGVFDDLGTLLKGDGTSSSSSESEAPPGNPSATRSPNTSDKRIALVIGNSSYTNSPLKNPVNDAKDIAGKLRKLGFDVIERTNLKTKQIGATLREFRSKLTPGATALVFYAGHGLQIKGDNYLPAVDADINSEEDVPNQSLAMKQIMDVLDESKSRLNLVFLDACRNNPYARSFRSAERGLARVSAPSGTLISYATRPGSVAADGDGRNGLYTSKLLVQMDSKQQIEQILKRVVTEVKTASQGKQEPWMEGSIEGDFCFGGCAMSGGGTQVASLEPVAIPPRVKSREQIEDEYWETVKDSTDQASFEQYLKAYPKGRYLNTANLKIAQLKKKPQEIAPVTQPATRTDPESDLWAEVQKSNDIDDYQAYLVQYPKGKYVTLAKGWIKKLHDAAASDASRHEQQAWDVADKSGAENDYQSYLKAWPTGRYAGLAQVRVRKLQTELELWRQAQAGGNAQTLQAYLDKYPSGNYAAEAQEKLSLIRNGPKTGTTFRDCAECPEMVIIPSGSFNMGSRNGDENELPSHKVIIDRPFAMGKSEVTQAQWKSIMNSNPSNYSGGFSSCDKCPVEKVSWNDAQEFIQKLNAKTGKKYRLPSEAEWEYSCRAGVHAEYCGGNNLDSFGWYLFNSNRTTHPIATKQANAFGLFDMSGNVYEWVEDSYHDSYKGAPVDGSAWQGDGIKRVVRGGAWLNNVQNDLRSAHRTGATPDLRGYDIGFRVARILP